MTSPLFRWVAKTPLQLSELLDGHGLVGALRDGRVFVDGRRAAEPQAIATGAVVEVFAPRPSASIELLHGADDVFAVYKPAALPTEPDKSGANCVLHQLAALLGRDVTELFAVSRLDVGVSGVLLVTFGPRAQQRLLQERAQGTLRRRYVALGAGVPQPPEGDWREALGRAGAGKRVVDDRDGQAAHTRYQVVATACSVARDRPPTSLLALAPVTGRTHQLRVHAAAHGAPLLGDRKYGGPARLTSADGSVQALSRVLLHAAWVEWGPKSKRELVASEPAELVDTWLALAGDPAAIQRALD